MTELRAARSGRFDQALAVAADVLFLFHRQTLEILDVSRPDGAFGYPHASLVGLGLDKLIAGMSRELAENTIARTHDPHPDSPLRVVLREPGGREVPVDVKMSAISKEKGVAVLRLMSEKARIDERELVTVIGSAPEAIVTWTPAGKIISFNPAAERLYGMMAYEAIGQPIEVLVPETARAEFRAAEQRLLAGEPRTIAEAVRLRGSQEIEVEESLFLVRDHGPHPLRIGSFTRDVGELARLRQATRLLWGGAPREDEPSARSAKMREIHDLADVAAREGAATVLLLGETGVGKSYLARRIHSKGPRAGMPFLEVNCSSFEPQLLESELFGHERGAFTGAATKKRGLVEVAEGGTVFLDEVAELPAAAQAKLLSFLDQRTFRRLGGTRTFTADVRVIAATNADLAQLVEEKRFRKDLFYRLRVMPIEIPPLRERREDIPRLAELILRELRGRATPPLLRETAGPLKRYAWPGNLRELRNTLERAVILSEGGPIGLRHLPVEVRERANEPSSEAISLAEVERRHVLRVLESTGGNRSRAAEILGVDRSTLRRKLAELNVRD